MTNFNQNLLMIYFQNYISLVSSSYITNCKKKTFIKLNLYILSRFDACLNHFCVFQIQKTADLINN